MRLRGKVDSNHSEIVRVLRKFGCSVEPRLASLGHGVPDLLVARAGAMALLELKDGRLPPSRRRLTDDELVWIENWKAPVYIVESIEDALRAVGL